MAELASPGMESSLMDENIRLALEAHVGEDGLSPDIVEQYITDTWLPNFIYRFFIEDVEQRQRVLDFVCKHRPGTNPSVGTYKCGSYNFCVEIVFDDGMALFRFPIPGVVPFPDDKTRAEVATIRYVAEHTSIPVPRIYHWGSAAENPTGLDVPFIIMEHIPHTTTVSTALQDPDYVIPNVPESEKRDYLYQKMADICLQLRSLESNRIGSLSILDDGDYAVSSAPLTHSMIYQVINCGVPVSVLPPRHKTYSSSAEYVADMADMQVAELLFMDNSFVDSVTKCESMFVARYLLRDLIRRRRGSEGSAGGGDDYLPGTTGAMETGQPRETFKLWCDDFRPDNILLDEAGQIVGVVDWEYTYFAPETYYQNPPWWLWLEFMKDDSDSDSDSGTDAEISGEEKQVNTADGGDDENDGEQFEKQWNELVDTFLRALDKAEERLRQNPNARPKGHFLCHKSSSGQAEITSCSGPQQLPVLSSQRMRHRWDKEKEEYFVTTALFKNFLFDSYFWDYIDQASCDWGENSSGGYEGRMQLLNGPARSLMDWFIHHRVSERRKWDPRALMDQVLAQMDGESSILLRH